MTASSLSPPKLGQLLLSAVERNPAPAPVTEIEAYLKQGAPVDYQDETGWTPLTVAVVHGYSEIAKVLLKHGADVNHHDTTQADPDKFTPLIRAVDTGRTGMAELLLDRGAEVDHVDADGWTALFWAASNNNDNPRENVLEIARMLLARGAQATRIDKTGSSPLIYAAEHNHPAMTRLLIEHGADINLTNKAGGSPLLFACHNGFDEVAEILLGSGADANHQNDAGVTPLIEASSNKHLKCAKLLLDHGAAKTVNNQANDGWAALFAAAKTGSEDIAQLLLANGADPKIANNFHWTPLLYAAAHSKHGVATMLLEAGARVNYVDPSGWSPLMHAARRGNTDLGKTLLAKGVDPKVASTAKCFYAPKGPTQPGTAAKPGASSSDQAPPTKTFGKGSTALMVAVAEAHVDFVELLVGACKELVDQVNDDGKNAAGLIDGNSAQAGKLAQLLKA